MSDKNDDKQTPRTSGTKPKEKANNVDVEKDREQANSNTRKDEEKKSSILKTKKPVTEGKYKKKTVKIASTEFPSHQRGASDQSSSRHRLAPRPNRSQKSTSISQIVPRREAAKRREPTLSTLTYTFEEPSTERDHQLALDFIEKSSPYSARESLLDLRRKEKEKKERHHHHHRRERTIKRHIHHATRCRSCLQIQDQCECNEALNSIGRKSDWAILVKADIDPPKTWTRQRLDWLEDLEANSKFDREQAEEKFSEEQDVCCFPFSTFRIFKKKELKDFEFYCKNSDPEPNIPLKE